MSRTARGKSAVSLLDFDGGEEITAVVNCDDLEDIEGCLTVVTRNGYIKQAGTDHFQNVLSAGIIATELDEGDELADVEVMGGESDLVIGTERGTSIRSDEDEVCVMGRSTRDARGIKPESDDVVAGVVVIDEDHHDWIFTVTENGYGKRTNLDAHHMQSKNGKGLIDIEANERNGSVCVIDTTGEGDHLVAMSDERQILRTPAEDISTIGRSMMGVTVVDPGEGNNVASVGVIPAAMTAEGEELNDADNVEEDAETGAKAGAKVDADDE